MTTGVLCAFVLQADTIIFYFFDDVEVLFNVLDCGDQFYAILSFQAEQRHLNETLKFMFLVVLSLSFFNKSDQKIEHHDWDNDEAEQN